MEDNTCFISQHRCDVNRARTPFRLNENTEELTVTAAQYEQ